MDSKEQKAGEKRVRDLLVVPLQRLGLGRPAGLTRSAFEAMCDEISAKLAYMTDDGLAALVEVVASHPGGKARDRFPIAAILLQWAADIEPPADSGSPLIRKVFGHEVGAMAIREGWAPELLFWLKRHRQWPKQFVLSQIRDGASGDVRRMQDIDARLARGADLTPEEVAFRSRRRASLDKCEALVRIVSGGAE